MNKQAVFRGNKLHKTLLEARKVAGSAKYKARDYKIVLSFRKQREFVYLVCFRHNKKINQSVSSLHCAPLLLLDCGFICDRLGSVFRRQSE